LQCGDFVGVRPGAYEEKTKENVSRLTRPYLLSDTQRVELEENQYSPRGRCSIQMEITFLRGHRRAPLVIRRNDQSKSSNPESNIYGNIDLSPPKLVNAADMWKDNGSPCGTDDLNKLKKAMGESYSIIMLLAFFLLLFRTSCGLETDNTCPTELWAYIISARGSLQSSEFCQERGVWP